MKDFFIGIAGALMIFAWGLLYAVVAYLLLTQWMWTDWHWIP